MSSWVGRPLKPLDARDFLTGSSRFIDDLNFPNQLHLSILRSPYSHARIRAVKLNLPRGKYPYLTGSDVARETLPLLSPLKAPNIRHYCLAVDKVRYMGEGVAAVACDNRYEAYDALEFFEVDYEPLDAVTDAEEALSSSAPILHEDHRSNVGWHRILEYGNVAQAFGEAEVIIEEKIRWERSAAAPIEPYGCVASVDKSSGVLTIWGNFQSYVIASGIAAALRLPREKVKLVMLPSGGSFGSKFAYKLCVLVGLMAMKTGRPVKYVETRSENLMAGDNHGPEMIYHARLAATAAGRLLGLDVRAILDMGAYMTYGAWQLVKPVQAFNGGYQLENCRLDLYAVMTNKSPQLAYRGFGMQSYNFLLERLMDRLADELRMDKVEIRRLNFIPKELFPYRNVAGTIYDSGDYHGTLDLLLQNADYESLVAQREALRKQGRLAGLGLAVGVEPGVLNINVYHLIDPEIPPTEHTVETAKVRVLSSGKIQILLPFASSGQSYSTSSAQVAADVFGCKPEEIEVLVEDSTAAGESYGPAGSREAVMLMEAIRQAASKIKAVIVKEASAVLGAPEESLLLKEGMIQAKGKSGKAIPIADIVASLVQRGQPPARDAFIEAAFSWDAPSNEGPPSPEGKVRGYTTFADSAHLTMVEVDPETFQVKILNYFIASDCGTIINPAIVDGQLLGGTVQGIGLALREHFVYREGQLLNSTFMDYQLPVADEVPHIRIWHKVTPSPFTPNGAKGVGESGIAVAPAAVVSAVEDALKAYSVKISKVPATPDYLYYLTKNTRH